LYDSIKGFKLKLKLWFTANSTVHAWEFVFDLWAVGGSYQLH
jgi:hypothetical protein